MNVLPVPRVLATSIAPPSSVTMPCTSESPRPVPVPTSLVVKKGRGVARGYEQGYELDQVRRSAPTAKW